MIHSQSWSPVRRMRMSHSQIMLINGNLCIRCPPCPFAGNALKPVSPACYMYFIAVAAFVSL